MLMIEMVFLVTVGRGCDDAATGSDGLEVAGSDARGHSATISAHGLTASCTSWATCFTL